MTTNVAIASMTISIVTKALVAIRRLEKNGKIPAEEATHVVSTALLLASVNFALERGRHPEECADVLEKFAARLRSGEAFEKADGLREEYRLWTEQQRAKAEAPEAEKGGA